MTKYEFDKKISNYKVSNAPFEVRQKAILELERQYPHFSNHSKQPSKELLNDILESQADIPKLD